jgi:hypothetical protein
VDRWDESGASESERKRADTLLAAEARNQKPFKRRPDKYDEEYDMGRLKKVKAKAADAGADGTPRANPFQGGAAGGGGGGGSGGKGSKWSKGGSGGTGDRGRSLRKRLE